MVSHQGRRQEKRTKVNKKSDRRRRHILPRGDARISTLAKTTMTETENRKIEKRSTLAKEKEQNGHLDHLAVTDVKDHLFLEDGIA